MDYQRFKGFLTSFALTLSATVALSLAAGSTVLAQNGYYRGRDYGRDRGYYDQDYYGRYGDDRHQKDEKKYQKRHEKQEKEDLKRHQREERRLYGNSEDLRYHQRREQEELNQHKRQEKEDLKYHQRSERGGYYNDGRYSRTDGYYDQYGNFHPYRRTSDGYYDEYGRFHPYRGGYYRP